MRLWADIVVLCDDVLRIFVDLWVALGYSGTACIDYKLDDTGQIRILEVNPRMGATLIHLADSYAVTYGIPQDGLG